MCRDIAKGAITGKTRLAAQISTIRLYKTKNGKNPGQLMAFVTAEDSSGELDSITVFPESYDKHKHILVEGNTVLMTGEISKPAKSGNIFFIGLNNGSVILYKKLPIIFTKLLCVFTIPKAMSQLKIA